MWGEQGATADATEEKAEELCKADRTTQNKNTLKSVM